MNTEDDGRLMTRGDVANRLNLSPERVRQLTVEGALPCLKTPLGRLYKAEAIEAFAILREQRRQAQR